MNSLANFFKNKDLLIYGIGKSGTACFNYLKKNNNVNIYDDKSSNIPKNFKKYSISKLKLIKKTFDNIVLSPGIDIKKCSIFSCLQK